MTGRGVTRDAPKAIQWWTTAAKLGLADAQFNLGMLLGSACDEREILEGGCLVSFAGLCYERGEGVAKDQARAVEWYTAAATSGFGDAQFNLGMLPR
jgi:TPR repeat protein